MKQTKLTIFFFLTMLLALALVACNGQVETPAVGGDLAAQMQIVSVEGGSYTDVTADGLATMLDDKDFPFINVHIPYEGEIEGTDAFIPFDQIEQNLDRLPADKDAQIVLYCRSGRMSTEAAYTLIQLGYTNIWNLDGGMVAWENSGRPLQFK